MSNSLKLGEGTYGCVLKGNMVYSTNKNNNTVFLNSNGEVTKIMIDEKDYNRELFNTFIANKLDINTSLIIHATSILDKNDIKNILYNKYNKSIIDKIGLCDNIINNLDNLEKIYQITYSDEGIMVDNLPKYIQHFNNAILIELFYNLFKSLYIYRKNDFNHHDIKFNNIIFIPKYNKIVFIDFGIACYSKDIDIKNYYRHLSSDYNNLTQAQPPEIIARALLSKNSFKNSKEDILKDYIERYNYVTTDNIHKLLIKYIYNTNENMNSELIRTFNNNAIYKIRESFYNLDTYKLCSTLVDYIYLFSNIIITEPYEEQFVEEFSRILAQALQIDPVKRLNINTLFNKYTRLIRLYYNYKKH